MLSRTSVRRTSAQVIPLTIALSAAVLSPAVAGRVQRVSAEAAQEGNVPITVFVEGGGVLLDFSPTGERIQKISLDDPSRVVVDHCLVTKSCGNFPSPVIRLFRSTGIKFQDIPAAKTTMLSVETISPQGEYQSYIFPLSAGTGRSRVSKILVGDDDAPRGTILTRSTAAPRTIANGAVLSRSAALPNTVAIGARAAAANAQLVDPMLKGRVRQYLQLTQGGMSSKKAAQKAGISMALVTRLDALGQTAIAQAQAKEQAAQAQAQAQEQAITAPAPTTITPPPPPTVETVSQPVPKPLKVARKVKVKNKKAIVPNAEPKLTDSSVKLTPKPLPEVEKPKISTQTPAELIPQPETSLSVAATPSTESKEPSEVVAPIPSTQNRHTQANTLVKGLMIARRQKKVSRTTAASVQDVIYLLRKGQSLTAASTKTRVPMATIQKLFSLAGS